MGSMVLDSVLAMAGRWLGSLASIFTSGPGLLVILAVLATAYLYRKLSKKIADKIGIGLGPIIALAVLAAVFFSLRGGLGRSSSPRQLREVLPPGLASAPAEDAQEAAATAATDPAKGRAAEKRRAAAVVAARDRAAVDDRIAGELAALTQGGLAPPQPPVLSLAPEIPPIQPPFIVAGAAVPAASQARPAAAPEATHAAETTPGGTKPGTTKQAAPPGKPATAASHGVGSPMPAATKGGYGARNGGLMGSRAAGGNVGTPGHHVKPRHYSGMGVPTMTYSQMLALERQQARAAMGNTPQPGMSTRNQAAGNRGGVNPPLGGYGARGGGRMTGQPFGGMTPGYGNGTGMGGGSPYSTPNPGLFGGVGPHPGGMNPGYGNGTGMGGYGGMNGGMQPGLWKGEPMGGLFHPTEGGRLGMPFHPDGSNAMNGGPPGGGSGPMTGSPMGGMGMGGFGGMTGGPMGGMGHVAGSVGGGHR